jgi:DNA-binding response OmpR family regulator
VFKRNEKSALVIDSDHDTRVLLRQYLEESGYVVTSFANGAVALDASDDFPRPIIVFVSSSLSFVSAEHIVRTLKENERFSKTPFVHLREGTDRQLPGTAATLVKPIDKWELLVTIERCLGAAAREKMIMTPPPG